VLSCDQFTYVAVLACVSFPPFDWAFTQSSAILSHPESQTDRSTFPQCMPKVDESPIFRRKHIISEERSVSVDRFKYTLNDEGGFTRSVPLVQEYHYRVVSPLASRPSQQHPHKPGSGEARFGKESPQQSDTSHKTNYFLL